MAPSASGDWREDCEGRLDGALLSSQVRHSGEGDAVIEVGSPNRHEDHRRKPSPLAMARETRSCGAGLGAGMVNVVVNLLTGATRAWTLISACLTVVTVALLFVLLLGRRRGPKR